ncbi:MAG: lytic transglycosylase domain-containing protein [candidate division KSB1 bacterium]|nr:lytic transglycosylase domain-containing protein [candidate division KSB1 bacterium]
MKRKITFGARMLHVCYVLFILLLFSVSASASGAETLPLPEPLKDNVRFWIKIFTQVSSDQVVLHDRNYPDIIYTVIPMDSTEDWEKVTRIRTYIEENLKALSQSGVVENDSLSRFQYDLYMLWSSVQDSAKFVKASENIRAQRGLKDRFQQSIVRSGRFLPYIKSVFNEYDIPEALCYLPHVESSFNWNARSKVGAAGMWQFTAYTARKYMRINSIVDERYDPITSTIAAARLLKDNYNELQSWPLAITAYNYGLNGIRRASEKHATRELDEIIAQHKSRLFGFASKNFYAEFYAAWKVSTQYKIYFGELDLLPQVEYKSVVLDRHATLDQLSLEYDIDAQTIQQYNPAYRISVKVIPAGYTIRLPITAGSLNDQS